MQPSVASLCFIFVFLIGHLCMAFRVLSAEPDANLQALITPPRTDPTVSRWMGGDSSASIPLEFGDGKKYSFFIYGDTVLGKVGTGGGRTMEHFIHNSVGILDRTSPGGLEPIQTFWQTTPEISAMFSPPTERYYYWLMSMFALPTADTSTDSFTEIPEGLAYDIFYFSPNVLVNSTEWIGMDGVTLIVSRGVTSTIAANPLLWRRSTELIPLPSWFTSEKNGFVWGVASAVVHPKDGRIYLFGNKRNVSDGVYLSRMTLNDFVTERWTRLEFYTKGGVWQQGAAAMDELAMVPGIPWSVPETTYTYFPEIGKWLMIANEPMGFDIYVFVADDLWGPWEKVFLYHIPPPVSTTKGLFCYAFKIHPELASLAIDDDADAAGEFVFTYNSNSMNFFVDEKNPDLAMMYVPQFVRVKYSA